MDITYTIATSDTELQQIITLQQNNLPVAISSTEKKEEGFVTVQHDFDILKKMNNRQPHIIAKKGGTVIGYALCMLNEFKDDIAVLQPMFSIIDHHLQPDTSYLVMGQICVDKSHRRQGVFRNLYTTMRNKLQTKYDLLITEVADTNTRSLQAHQAIGFKTLVRHESHGTQWHLIYWDWS